jgi:hypothetical protein
VKNLPVNSQALFAARGENGRPSKIRNHATDYARDYNRGSRNINVDPSKLRTFEDQNPRNLGSDDKKVDASVDADSGFSTITIEHTKGFRYTTFYSEVHNLGLIERDSERV